MISKSALDAYREKVFEALRAEGCPIDDWHRQYEQDLAANPRARPRPFTTLIPPKYGKITKIRPGFEEFVSHPRHGQPIARCQAAKKRTDGKIQCGKFAIRGRHLCRSHGGGSKSGKLSDQGRQRQVASVTQHGDETVAKRAARSEASKQRRALEKTAREFGIYSGLGSRGPYHKPNRVGQPMGHLRKAKPV